MTELSKKQEGALINQDAPHYYMVYIENQIFEANTRCCGTKKDLEMVLRNYPDARWEKIYLPRTPDTVDVMYVDAGEEQVLQAQQILPESQSKPLNL